MTQEYKNLLLQDLCGRLPYGVKVQIKDEIVILDSICDDDGYYFNFIGDDREGVNIENIKPYLFPLSSMTEEIMDEIYEVSGVYDIGIDSPVHIEVGTTFEDLTKIFHILNKYHIDYMGLIPMGLALDATGKNIY